MRILHTGDIHLGDAVAAPGKGDKSQIGGASPHLAEEKSPFAQLVEAAAAWTRSAA